MHAVAFDSLPDRHMSDWKKEMICCIYGVVVEWQPLGAPFEAS